MRQSSSRRRLCTSAPAVSMPRAKSCAAPTNALSEGSLIGAGGQRLRCRGHAADQVAEAAVGIARRAEQPILDLLVHGIEDLAATHARLLLAQPGAQQLVDHARGGDRTRAGAAPVDDQRFLLRHLARVALGVGVGDVVGSHR